MLKKTCVFRRTFVSQTFSPLRSSSMKLKYHKLQQQCSSTAFDLGRSCEAEECRSCTGSGQQSLNIPLLLAGSGLSCLSSQHSSVSGWYLSLLRSLASSIRSSQGTVNSNKRTCLEKADVSTTSGLQAVGFMYSGNLSCLP